MVAPSEQVFGIDNFTGGLNTSIHASRLEDNELSEATNIQITRAGSIIPRPKKVTFFTGDFDLGAVLGFYHNAPTMVSYLLYYRYGASGLDLTAVDSNGVTTVIETYVGPDTDLLNAHVIEYADKAYIIPCMDGGICELDSLTPTTILDAPDLVCGIVHKDRLFGAEENSQRLYFSDVGDFATWGDTSFIDIHGVDPSPITSFEILNDVLYIFKQNSIHGLYVQGDPSTWSLRLINPHLGATTKHATVTYEGEIFFFSNKGLYVTDGLSFENVGRKVFEASNTDIVPEQAEVARFNDRILVSFGAAWSFVYDLEIGAWVRWSLGAHSDVIDNQIERGDFLAVPYFMGTNHTINYLHPSEVEESSVIGIFTTKWYDMGAPTYMKKTKFWAIEYSGELSLNSIAVEFDAGKQETVDLDEQGIEGITEQSLLFKFNTSSALHFRRVRFRVTFLSNPVPNLPTEMPTILGLFAHYELENRVKENI